VDKKEEKWTEFANKWKRRVVSIEIGRSLNNKKRQIKLIIKLSTKYLQ
jgi:hypothetical protein